MSQPRVAVFGKNSAIGRPLVAALSSRGFDVVSAGSADCDFRDASAVARYFDRLAGSPLAVVFLAVVNKTVQNSYDAFVENVSMVRNLAAGLRRVTADSLLYFSSADVYGRPDALPITERTPIAPDTWYGLAK